MTNHWIQRVLPGLLLLWTGPMLLADSLDALLDDYFQQRMREFPQTATSLGLPDSLRIHVDEGRLNDASLAAGDRYYESVTVWLVRLDSVEREPHTLAEILEIRLFRHHLLQIQEEARWRFHDYVIDPMFGFHNALTRMLTEHHSLEDEEDARNYIRRLLAYPEMMRQRIDQMEARQKRGIAPPRHIMAWTRDIAKEFIATSSREHLFFKTFWKKVRHLNTIDDSLKLALYNETAAAIEQAVIPAYQTLADYLDGRERTADERAGVWSLPDGDAFYSFCLKRHAPSSLSAESIHALGRKEVTRIQKEMMRIFRHLGVPSSDFLQMERAYWERSRREWADRMFYPSARRHEVLTDYQEMIQQAMTRVPDLFDLIPETPVTVAYVPDFMQGTSGAHYSRASVDGRRKGVFYVNPRTVPDKGGMPTLAYHEAVPGHHFQLALQQERFPHRLYRHLIYPTAFIEGWALYAEKLADEQGWFSDDHARLGYLRSELLRAARLVLDTGLHWKRWTRQEAFEAMQRMLGWASWRSIDRYILWPGQACAYKIGELRILKWRKKMKKAKGGQFDLKAFHRQVLENGALPLDLLDEQFITLLKK